MVRSSPNVRSLLLPLAIFLLSVALFISHGLFGYMAISLVLLAMLCFLAWAPVVGSAAMFDRLLVWGIAVQCVLIASTSPLNDRETAEFLDAWPYYLLPIVAWTSTVMVTFRNSRVLALLMSLGACALMGVWVIRTNTMPNVDVFTYQKDSAAALLSGVNPYAITFPNPYGAEGLWTFAPGAATESEILFGYPYNPVSLLLILPGHLLGDHRYALLAAILITAIAPALLTRFSRTGVLLSLVLLTMPRLAWVIEWGWTEPLLAALLATTLMVRRISPTAAAIPLGLFFASKQYLALLLPAARRHLLRPASLILCLVTGLLATLPLILWNPQAYWHSAVALQFHQPFREDALSVPALVFALTHYKLPTLLPFIVLPLGIYLAFWRNKTLTELMALLLPIFFLLSKQAFFNYYFLVICVWILAAIPKKPGTP